MTPTLLVALTPSGGTHEYYALAEGEKAANSASKIGPKVDVRGYGGYVLVPPSRVGGKPYAWECNTDEDGLPTARPAYRSDALLAKASEYKERHKDHDVWKIDPDLPENIKLAIDYLEGRGESRDIAIEGQGGNYALYRTAAMVRSFGLAEETALDILWKHYNPLCQPPWGIDELDEFIRTIGNAYFYATSPPGNLTPAYREATHRDLFKPVSRDTSEGDIFDIGRFTGMDYVAFHAAPEPEWLIENFIPKQGYVILFGASGSYKSYLALHLALILSTDGTDGPWAKQCTEIGPVVYMAGEGGTSLMSERARAWEKLHKPKETPDFYFFFR